MFKHPSTPAHDNTYPQDYMAIRHKDYILVRGKLMEVQKEVNERLETGWFLWGSPVAYCNELCQAMCRWTDQLPKEKK
jgi:hypothetical protein